MNESRQRKRRSAPGGSDPAARGLILVLVAVVLGAILLAAGGQVGFDADDEGVDIGDSGSEATDTTAAPGSSTSEAPPETVPPAQVAVVVANAAGIDGLAGRTTEFLATQGYSNTTATDAPSDVASTVVYFAKGFEPNAAAIASLFSLPPAQVQPLPAEPVANEQPPGTAIVLVAGPDAEPVVSGAATTAPVTTAPATTAPG